MSLCNDDVTMHILMADLGYFQDNVSMWSKLWFGVVGLFSEAGLDVKKERDVNAS